VLNAGSAEAAQRFVASGKFDAIVLDLRLPGKDGRIPARIARVARSDAGADSDGAWRARRAGRRPRCGSRRLSHQAVRFSGAAGTNKGAGQETWRCGPACAQGRRPRTGHGEASCTRRDGRELSLSPKETILLELLMRNAGQVVTRNMIAEVVWGTGYNDFTNLIEVFVNRLRQKINDGVSESLIVTVRGAGYSMRKP
jgi:DNA-binding response OmpR family regulator